MTTVNEDIDAISAEPKPLTLESGLPIKVLRIRTRATMSLLKILTRGAGEALATIRFGADTTQEEFTGQLLGAVIVSIPEAEEETIEFLNRVVEPANLIDKPRLTPGDIEYNADQEDLLRAELRDPSLDDLVTIVSEIISIEGPHIMALGKRLAALLPTALKVEEQKKDQPQKPAKKVAASSKSASKG
jgi:hypothetical protein